MTRSCLFWGGGCGVEIWGGMQGSRRTYDNMHEGERLRAPTIYITYICTSRIHTYICMSMLFHHARQHIHTHMYLYVYIIQSRTGMMSEKILATK